MFTADGAEWREKRASVAHSVFRRSGGKGLSVLANEEADSLLKEVEALLEGADAGEVRDTHRVHTRSCLVYMFEITNEKKQHLSFDIVFFFFLQFYFKTHRCRHGSRLLLLLALGHFYPA